MSKFLIESVQVGVSAGGMACGPVSGNVIAEVKVRRDDKVWFYSCAEVDGMPLFYLTEESTYDRQIAEEDDDFFIDLQDKQFAGYDSYEEFYDDIKDDDEDPDLTLLMKYIVYLIRAEWKELEKLEIASIGKYTGDFEIPVCDAEEDYLDMMEDEED